MSNKNNEKKPSLFVNIEGTEPASEVTISNAPKLKDGKEQQNNIPNKKETSTNEQKIITSTNNTLNKKHNDLNEQKDDIENKEGTENKQENTKNNAEIFDATVETPVISNPEFEREMEQIRKKAILERELLENTKHNPDNSKKAFTTSVAACLISVFFLLALTLVLFFWAKWYVVGIAFALITIIIIQVWISYFKRLNKKQDFMEEIASENNIDAPDNKTDSLDTQQNHDSNKTEDKK